MGFRSAKNFEPVQKISPPLRLRNKSVGAVIGGETKKTLGAGGSPIEKGEMQRPGDKVEDLLVVKPEIFKFHTTSMIA
jgi:hypothetical protein